MNGEPKSLVEFVMSLFGDEKKAAEFSENAGKCMADAGLEDVTPEEVNAVIPVIAESVTPPSGGGGFWSPTVPSSGSPAEIIQNVVNQYYDQSVHVTNTGSGNVDVDVSHQTASGDGAVVVGGNANGPIATTGGVAGNDNTVGNSSDDHSIEVDKSIHGNNSGNASDTRVVDNSRNDSHNKVDVGPMSTATTMPVPPAPVPVPMDPFDTHGTIPFVPDDPYVPVDAGPAEEPVQTFPTIDPGMGNGPIPDVGDGEVPSVPDSEPEVDQPMSAEVEPELGISTSDIIPTEEAPEMVTADMSAGPTYAPEPVAVAEAPAVDPGGADF